MRERVVGKTIWITLPDEIDVMGDISWSCLISILPFIGAVVLTEVVAHDDH